MEREVAAQLVNVSKSFGKQRILENVELKLHRGENLVVLGRSGMGKSVLIKCIVRLVEPDSGRVEVFGENILEQDDVRLNVTRRKIGFLFQGGALYDSMTVRENLEFPLRRQRPHRSKEEMGSIVTEALQGVGLEHTLNKMPSQLSGGMRKRISLARTLVLKPDIMLYDEPTTGLDPGTSKEISELILKVQEKYNTASIIITHDPSCARITANRVAWLQQGRLSHYGSIDNAQSNAPDFLVNFFK
ncbi:MAG TPA: ATP-binding cassette domain-containing protein [Bacteroidia bacterium]|jgi:phospholipid/cholesterol/gamma-HCH transport system ATP-binding protein